MLAILAAIPENITLSQRIGPVLAALLITAAAVELIRRRQLREEYAMLWIFASGVLVLFAIWPRLLWHISNALGLYYLTTLVLMCFAFLALVLMHISVMVSRMSDDKRRITQHAALLQQQLDTLRRRQETPTQAPQEK